MWLKASYWRAAPCRSQRLAIGCMDAWRRELQVFQRGGRKYNSHGVLCDLRGSLLHGGLCIMAKFNSDGTYERNLRAGSTLQPPHGGPTNGSQQVQRLNKAGRNPASLGQLGANDTVPNLACMP